MATPDLDRLAKYVRAHRHERYPSRDAAAEAAGITRNTWKKVEEGLEVREATYIKIERALGWAGGSCLGVAGGGEPVLAGAATDLAGLAPMLSADAVRRAAFEAARAKLPNAPIGDIDAFSDELVEVLRRAGQVADGG